VNINALCKENAEYVALYQVAHAVSILSRTS